MDLACSCAFCRCLIRLGSGEFGGWINTFWLLVVFLELSQSRFCVVVRQIDRGC